MQRNIAGYFFTLVAQLICTKECLCDISPSIWQSYINELLIACKVESIVKQSWMVFCYLPNQKVPHCKIRRLTKGIVEKWPENIPKKCQLFRTDLQYMGNTIFLKDKRVCVKPLRNRLEAIQKLQPPTTVKGCRSVLGMVNFLSMFCP